MASYPASLYTAPTLPGLMSTAPTHSTVHNDANAEIQALESTLGTNPQGGAATVKARLDAIDTADWTAYNTWTPVNITVGNGTKLGRYRRSGVGGSVVHWTGQFIMGSTSVMGAAAIPFPIAGSTAAGAPAWLGTALFYDATGRTWSGTCWASDGVSLQFALSYDTSGTLSTTVPFTWATSDALSWSITYETDV